MGLAGPEENNQRQWSVTASRLSTGSKVSRPIMGIRIRRKLRFFNAPSDHISVETKLHRLMHNHRPHQLHRTIIFALCLTIRKDVPAVKWVLICSKCSHAAVEERRPWLVFSNVYSKFKQTVHFLVDVKPQALGKIMTCVAHHRFQGNYLTVQQTRRTAEVTTIEDGKKIGHLVFPRLVLITCFCFDRDNAGRRGTLWPNRRDFFCLFAKEVDLQRKEYFNFQKSLRRKCFLY